MRYFIYITFLSWSNPRERVQIPRILNYGWVCFDEGSIIRNSFYVLRFLRGFCWGGHHTWIINAVPIVGQPDESGETECHPELSADVVVVERLVVPISIPEDHTTHLINIINIFNLYYTIIITSSVAHLVLQCH